MAPTVLAAGDSKLRAIRLEDTLDRFAMRIKFITDQLMRHAEEEHKNQSIDGSMTSELWEAANNVLFGTTDLLHLAMAEVKREMTTLDNSSSEKFAVPSNS